MQMIVVGYSRQKRLEIIPIRKVENIVFRDGRLEIYSSHKLVSTEFREKSGMFKLLKLIQDGSNIYIVDGRLRTHRGFLEFLRTLDNFVGGA